MQVTDNAYMAYQILPLSSIDTFALSLLQMERAYSTINERGARGIEIYFQLIEMIPSLQVKYPQASEFLQTLLDRLTASRRVKEVTTSISHCQDYFGRIYNNTNFRTQFMTPSSSDLSVTQPLIVPVVTEEAITSTIIGKSGSLQIDVETKE